ncbi:bifunctional oligoribonuclease/PAP phosphatase NrnA [Gordonia sp. TBRC 11910]|uniref:Bifunctional oligoribonuclease/PAP phosphatase NrnA n=1 Tax=Gordonia asplenii TaxID=2725283 RepID=A0A848KSI3_9ACTN|nr:bifunctional oligoribonuclease/PAP phosphatase NrnA [Gordonia asplenii]NMN99834.1 bifunctional oligoribonuclease/PAP phosphatase NrnA [Gordonia asplenii]
MLAPDTAHVIADALRDAGAVTILCHVRPDADTIGSGLALGIALTRLGVDVEVSFPGETPLPGALRGLPGVELLVAQPDVVGHDTVVAVDAASIGRLTCLASYFNDATRSIVIDHHVSNTGFGTIDYVDPGADCTTALVLNVVDRLGVDLDADIATCLYAGLITDTGSFKWARPASLTIAARLLEAGVDGARWSRTLLDSHPFAWLKMVEKVLATATLRSEQFGGRGLVYAVIDADASDGLGWAELESVIDVVRTVVEAEVAVVFKEGTPGEWTVSLRSKSSVDLVPVARALGGGGHHRACGYSARGDRDEVVADLLNTIGSV